MTVRFITGGASNDLFEITRGGQRLALRRPPEPIPKGRNETMLREFRLLSALADTDVPHARVRAGCDDTEVLGGCFYMMEFVDGWSPIQEGTIWPEPFGSDLVAARAASCSSWSTASPVSRGWTGQAKGLEGFGRPDGFHERQVDRWLSHLAAVQFRPLPGIDEAAAVAACPQTAHLPARHHARRLPVRQRDVPPRRPARLAAIVDWEMATVGDPLLDLGWVINGWPDDTSRPDEADGQLRRLHRDALRGRAARTTTTDRSGRPVDEIDYYVILARFKLAIVLEAGYARGGRRHRRQSEDGQASATW